MPDEALLPNNPRHVVYTLCLCHQAVLFGTGQRLVMPCDCGPGGGEY